MKKRLILVFVCVAGLVIGYCFRVGVWRLRARDQIAWPELHSYALDDPSFTAALRSLHAHENQMGIDGRKHAVNDISGVNPEDGKLLYDICRTVKARNTLEIGFAYGVSTMYILAALRANGFGTHTAIDPFEKSEWDGIGLQKVVETHSEAQFRFIEEKSITAIHQLSGQQYDFIFIDGSHLFDDALLDFKLADTHCSDNCVIAFHDAGWMPAVQKTVHFIERNRADYVRLRSPVGIIALFRRIGTDKRDWQHFADF